MKAQPRPARFPAAAAASALDKVEFVSLWVGERGPVSAGMELVELLGAHSFQAGEFGGEVVGDEVEVQPVLDGLALGYFVEGDAGARGGDVAGCHDGVVAVGAFSDGTAEGGRPEGGCCLGVAGVVGEPEYGAGHAGPFTVVRLRCGRRRPGWWHR